MREISTRLESNGDGPVISPVGVGGIVSRKRVKIYILAITISNTTN